MARERLYFPHEWPIEDEDMPLWMLKEEALDELVEGCKEKGFLMVCRPDFRTVPGPVSRLATVVEVVRA